MNRLKQLDSLRGLAIALMVLNHAGHYLTARPVSLPIYFSIYLTVAWAGPLFLFVSGYCLFLAYQCHPEFKRFLKRGLWLVVCGFLINLFFYFDEPFYRGRILLALGLGAMAIYPFLKMLKQPKTVGWLLSMSLLGIFISPWVCNLLGQINSPLFKDLFVSEFPLYPWFFVLLLGAVSAKLIVGLKAEYLAATYRWIAGAGTIMMLIWFVGSIYAGRLGLWLFSYDLNVNGYWLPSFLTWLWVLGGVIFWWAVFGLMELRLARIGQAKLPLFDFIYSLKANFLAVLGRQALLIYFLQFFLTITVGEKLLNFRVAGFLGYLFISLFIILILWCLAILKARAGSTASSRAKPMGKIF
jgi:uncharacterized membrane protein